MSIAEISFEVIRIVVASALFFVWVVRYENIVNEFEQYRLPAWLRDLTGVLKVSFAVMLLWPARELNFIGIFGLAIFILVCCFALLLLSSWPGIFSVPLN